MSEVVERYSALFALIGIGIWVTTIATMRVLRKLNRERPEVLRGVGVTEVDWWFSSWRGIFLLRFSQQGICLSSGQRWMLRGCILSSAALVVSLGVIAALG
ncbi:hypothetical protein [Stenotrophomonas oahuensis]|uniref:Transmembrane protein n=1 Tax=Stenotrophomonas oahuensis TaxID=3003271 RepID=A0ABY9YN28_9GAMM|nr:hypothetical protein [Stenotrophomonas sp. A5586]WNH52302.1 hypothetical protein PDM29_18535 [Stenotrophomonas sp. A5586]